MRHGRLTVNDEVMNSTLYQKIPKGNIQPSSCILKLKCTWVMQQDYDPKHTRNKMRSILYLLLFTLYIFYLKLFDVWQILKQTKKIKKSTNIFLWTTRLSPFNYKLQSGSILVPFLNCYRDILMLLCRCQTTTSGHRHGVCLWKNPFKGNKMTTSLQWQRFCLIFSLHVVWLEHYLVYFISEITFLCLDLFLYY